MELDSSVMLNDGPLSDGMTRHVRSVSCPHTRPKTMIPYISTYYTVTIGLNERFNTDAEPFE